ncbi:hypothetical protein J437_LFUL015728 [Ladona fulva]|uniref:DNA helicase n=1 Tax=Ladona fulva TaxID=123851 RepID=A0A8K0KHW2_LADFU|nr:hypothetical protein J437_LFUL015728 [Ladona fulva]
MRVQLSNDKEARHFAKKLLQIDELVHKVYPNIVQNHTNSNWLFERAILTVRNEVTDDINLKIQNNVPGEEGIYKSIDSMVHANESLSNNIIEAKIMSGKDKGKTVFIPRILLISTNCHFNSKDYNGQVIITLSHSQLYVDCSRVGNPKNLFIYSPNNKMKNVVYKQVFNHFRLIHNHLGMKTSLRREYIQQRFRGEIAKKYYN